MQANMVMEKEFCLEKERGGGEGREEREGDRREGRLGMA